MQLLGKQSVMCHQKMRHRAPNNSAMRYVPKKNDKYIFTLNLGYKYYVMMLFIVVQ
jgi:hypothetical protein